MTSNTQQAESRNMVRSHTSAPVNRQQSVSRGHHARNEQLVGRVHNVGNNQFQQQYVQRQNNQIPPISFCIKEFLAKDEGYKQNTITNFWFSLTLRRKENIAFNDPALKALIAYTREAIDRLNIDSVGKLASSLVRLGCNEQSCIQGIKSACIRHLSNEQLNVQAFINIIRSIGVSKSWDANFINSVQLEVFKNVKKIDNFRGKEIAGLLWSLASFQTNYKENHHLIDAIKAIVHSKLKIIDFFDLKDLVNIEWAFAKFEYPITNSSIAFVNDLKAAIICAIKAGQVMDDSDLFKLIWALAKFKCKDFELIEYLQNTVYNTLQRENYYDGHKLSKIMWSSAVLNKNSDLQMALEIAIVSKLRQGHKFYALDYSNMLWAVERYQRGTRDNFLNIVSESLLNSLSRKEFLEPKALSNVAFVLVKLECKNFILIESLRSAICECLKSPNYFDGRALSFIAYFFANYGYGSEDNLTNYMSVLDNGLRNKMLLSNLNIAYIVWSLVMMNKVGTFNGITQHLLKVIDYRFKNSLLDDETLQLLVQIRAILLIEEKEMQIPWDDGLINVLINRTQNNAAGKGHMLDLHTIIKTIDRIYRGQSYTKNVNSYIAGFCFDVTLEIGNRRIAIEAENSSALVQRHLTKFRVVQKAGWEILSFPEEFNYLGKSRKIAYIEARLKSANSLDDIQLGFGELSIQEDGGQHNCEDRQRPGVVPHARFMQNREVNYQPVPPMQYQQGFYFDHTLQQNVPYLMQVSPVVEQPAMAMYYPQAINQQFVYLPYPTIMFPTANFVAQAEEKNE